jgi:hypothetical protein
VYVATWLFGGFVFYLLINSIFPLSISYLPAMIGIWSISAVAGSVTMFVPSGLGVREVALSVMLDQYLPFSIAVVVAVVYRVFLTINEVIWTLTVLAICRYLGRRAKPKGVVPNPGSLDHPSD